eukprot:TRINITY_DN20913_c0_g1_i1.p1 TRINITY_DN20913_c0_g1~~TRINITY_DN20913_c0_g1_i1.p1  ORF type:complete len:610 (+),score=85.38 TRINITY_DN20913_c0_g1_i1:40-1830(+)
MASPSEATLSEWLSARIRAESAVIAELLAGELAEQNASACSLPWVWPESGEHVGHSSRKANGVSKQDGTHDKVQSPRSPNAKVPKAIVAGAGPVLPVAPSPIPIQNFAQSEDLRSSPSSRALQSVTQSAAAVAATMAPASVGHAAQHKKLVQKFEEMNLVHKRSRLGTLVESSTFELCSILLILANTVVMSLEAQYVSYDTGQAILYPGYTVSAAEMWPGIGSVLTVMDIFFLFAFTIELILRVCALRARALRVAWIWFDGILVCFGFINALQFLDLGLNPTLLRLVRITRLVRVVRVARSIQACDALFLLIKSIQASVGALCWSFSFLLAVQITIGLCLCQYFNIFIADETVPDEVRHRCFMYFGSFTRMIITMFEITLSNWVVSCRFFMDYVSEWFAAFYVVYVCMWCFAVLRVVTAVFITETNRVASQDLDMAIRRRNREGAQDLQSLRDLFSAIDTDMNGCVTLEELKAIVDNPVLKTWLMTVGVDSGDLSELYQLLASADGDIRLEDFIEGVKTFRGCSKEIHLVALSKLAKTIDSKIDAFLATAHYYSKHALSPAHQGSDSSRSAPATAAITGAQHETLAYITEGSVATL